MESVLGVPIRRREELVESCRPERSISSRCCQIEVSGRGVNRRWPQREHVSRWENGVVHFAQRGPQEVRWTQARRESRSSYNCRSENAGQATCTPPY